MGPLIQSRLKIQNPKFQAHNPQIWPLFPWNLKTLGPKRGPQIYGPSWLLKASKFQDLFILQ